MGRSVLKNFVLLGLFVGLASYSFGQSSKAKVPEPQGDAKLQLLLPSVERKALPNDFPVMVDTGNKEVDKEKYAESKAKWVGENPKRYAKLTDGNSVKQ